MNNGANGTEWKPEVELGRNWPQQIIVDHGPYWRSWRQQADGNLLPQSRRLYDDCAAHWIRFANGKDLKPRLLLEWHEYTKTIRSKISTTGFIGPRKLRAYHSQVKAYLKWLHLVGAISVDPSGCMPTVHEPAPPPKQIFTHEEYRTIVAYAMSRADTMVIGWLVVIGYHTGMSLVDCATLKWDEVFMPADGPCYIRRVRQKMRRSLGVRAISTIPIIVGGELWVWLKRLERRRHENSERGSGIDYVHQEAGQAYDRTYDAADMRDALTDTFRGALGKTRNGRSYRHLRNSFASRLINAGVDSVLVAKMTGHARIDQLSEYVVPDQAAMQEAILRGLRFVEGEPAAPSCPPIEQSTPNQESAV